ncbi:Bardet-Biedl syndrome 5 -like protein [Trichinella murrelli]|uniref:Bardet-Biedl syndrome 5-like protein n=2 Tax=Trichinella TaxID=6333 RepID=A0A0V0TCB3_9BILA|nr:Bardet-Biedl syndrome 5 -like protein [Trichinella murrelli]
MFKSVEKNLKHYDVIWEDREFRYDVDSKQLKLRNGEFIVDKLHGIENTKGNREHQDVSVKWSTHIEGHFPLLESSTPVDDQVTDSSSVRRCTVAGYRAAHRDLLHFDSATKQSWLPMATHFEEFVADHDEKYKLDLPWIDQTPKSPAGHGLVSPKGEQPKSSRLHFDHVTLRGGWTKTWVKVRCAALCLMDLLATVANSRNYKFTQSTPFFPFLIFRVERIGGKPNDVSSSPLGHTVSRTFHFFGKTYHQKLILSSASGLLPVASDMVRVHERGGGSSTPLSTPSNNRARSARNRNAFYGFFMNLPEELFLTLWMNIFGIVNLLFLWDTNMNYSSQLPVQNKMCKTKMLLKEPSYSRGQQLLFHGLRSCSVLMWRKGAAISISALTCGILSQQLVPDSCMMTKERFETILKYYLFTLTTVLTI